MKNGSRRHLITIEQHVDTLDPVSGGTVKTWDGFTRAWASIKMSRGRELVAAQAARSEIIGTFNIRWFPGVNSTMRILYNEQYYNITAVVNVNEANREMDIMVSSGLNKG